MKIIIDNKEITIEQVREWEQRRLGKAYKFLRKAAKLEKDERLENAINKNNTQLAEKLLAQIKYQIGANGLENMLRPYYTWGDRIAAAAAKVSKGGRKFSITDFVVKKENHTLDELVTAFEDIQLQNSNNNRELNLLANPDHYVSIGHPNEEQEVIEVTGGSPLPTHFYLTYDDDLGLQSEADKNKYPIQLPGVAKTEDGDIVGGVRHQFGETNDEFLIRALVEFPSASPNYMIRQHEWHLACEFSHWINDILA